MSFGWRRSRATALVAAVMGLACSLAIAAPTHALRSANRRLPSAIAVENRRLAARAWRGPKAAARAIEGVQTERTDRPVLEAAGPPRRGKRRRWLRQRGSASAFAWSPSGSMRRADARGARGRHADDGQDGTVDTRAAASFPRVLRRATRTPTSTPTYPIKRKRSRCTSTTRRR
jgi:hypothetical protein